ncbi:MAG: DUF5666 domain-containing protein, partial [Woeseiaceae bacterium]
ADLGLNIKVEAEGTLDGNGTLVAEKIDFRRGRAVRVMALADSVNAAADSLVVLGITVNIDELTRMEDKSDADVSPLSLANINSGDYVEIRGTEFPAGSGTLLAGRFEREDPNQDTILQGFVVSIGQPSFEILGVTIETNGATVFQDINDNVISAADFFSQVAPNSLVKAKGTEVSDSTLVATEVEFQLEL